MRFLTTILMMGVACLGQESAGEKKQQEGPGKTTATDRALEDIGDRMRTVAQKRIGVIWMVDASSSMADDVKTLQSKLRAIFKKVEGEKDLWMAVMAFDRKTRVVSLFTNKFTVVEKAIGSIGTAGKGVENCMAAIREGVQSFPKGKMYRMLVLVTDERGNDQEDLEKTIAVVKQAKAHIYVLGREAPFGWGHGYEMDVELGFNVTVDAGPESAGSETVQKNPLCCFQTHYPWCRKMLTDEMRRTQAESAFQQRNPMKCDLGEDAAVSSGFGCWAQARLVKETGGEYYRIRKKSEYEAKDLKGYEPELCSREEWIRRIERCAVRKEIISILETMEKGESFELESSGLSKGMTKSLVRRVRKVEREVQGWIKSLRNAKFEVSTGEAKPYKRWIAHRDLLMAQLYSLLHWLEQYRLTVLEGLWPKGGDVGLFTSPKVQGDKKGKAKEKLEEVIRDHPGTPWARTADLLRGRLQGFTLRKFGHGPGGGGARSGEK